MFAANVMAAAKVGHLHWRMNIQAISGGATEYATIGEIQMRASVGGADQCTGGTAIAGSAYPGYPALAAFDNDDLIVWLAGSATGTGWIGYTFASPVSVAEFHIVPYIYEGAPYATRRPTQFTLDWSDNGTNWTTARTINETASNWVIAGLAYAL